MNTPNWLPDRVRRPLRVARQYARVVLRRAERAAAPARRAWRRSLQLRVVALTLVASSLLVGAFGWLVAYRSGDILVNRAQDEVEAQLRGKVEYALLQLTVHFSVGDPKLPTTINDTVAKLSDGDPGQTGGSVVELRAADFPTIQPVTSAKVDIDPLITPEMVREVARNGQIARQIETADIGNGRH